jgi:hypothetical protein
MRSLLLFIASVVVTFHFLAVALGFFGAAIQTVAVLWIPIGMVAFLVLFPLIAVVGRSTLFYGLFDLDLSPRMQLPIRQFVVTLGAFSVSASAWSIFRLILVAGPNRRNVAAHYWPFINWLTDLQHTLTPAKLLAAVGPPLALAAFFSIFSVVVSTREGRPMTKVSLGVLAGLIVDAVCGVLTLWAAQSLLSHAGNLNSVWPGVRWALKAMSSILNRLGDGYQDPYWPDHVFAMLAAVMTLVLYVALGYVGARKLGSPGTIPALVGPLMSVLLLGWWGSALEFYLAGYNIPLLLVVVLWGLLNGALPFSDHTYAMLPRSHIRPPLPFEVLTANGKQRAIVVASAGGGIQAAAWTAKVLEELHWQHGAKFDESLSLISSISGGSMGSAAYVNWIDKNADPALQTPFDAASASSLDEVSWGLGWPDLLRLFFPLPCSLLIDRAHAMERAWCGNTLKPGATLGSQLCSPLSHWNDKTARGQLPALIMNSTMIEVGGPLLLGTSRVAGQGSRASRCWKDGDELHVELEHGRHIPRDIPAVRAARLSATFPYVTPAARPDKAICQPHMMDGGFYDNYGMATLTEWLDQALEEQETRLPGSPQVKEILVLQINGFPPPDYAVAPPPGTRGGWAKQLIAPILALVSVRTAGQVSHRDIELDLLCGKWANRGITIRNANFELNKEDAPLSWHLTPSQIQEIKDAWRHPDSNVAQALKAVNDFLSQPAENLHLKLETDNPILSKPTASPVLQGDIA